MTLDEAIQHTREVACENHDCAYEHKQLAGWLQELKQSREYIERLENALCNAFINEEGFATCGQDCDFGICPIDCEYLQLVEIVKEIIERGQINDK